MKESAISLESLTAVYDKIMAEAPPPMELRVHPETPRTYPCSWMEIEAVNQLPLGGQCFQVVEIPYMAVGIVVLHETAEERWTDQSALKLPKPRIIIVDLRPKEQR